MDSPRGGILGRALRDDDIDTAPLRSVPPAAMARRHPIQVGDKGLLVIKREIRFSCRDPSSGHLVSDRHNSGQNHSFEPIFSYFGITGFN